MVRRTNEWDMFMDAYGDYYSYAELYPDSQLLAERAAAVAVENKRKTIEKLQGRGKYSPDFYKLRLYDNILLFVYDTMKQNGNENKYLKDASYLGEARTSHNHFLMKSAPRGPVIFNNTKNDKRGFIRGECYAISPKILLDIDYVMSNQFVFRREEKFIFLMDQEYKTTSGNRRPSVKAWVYMGVPEFWEDKTIHPSPRTIPHGNKTADKGYYEFFVHRRSEPANLPGIWRAPYEDHARWVQ